VPRLGGEELAAVWIFWIERRGITKSLSAPVYWSKNSGVAMIALHQRGQRVKERFRAIQRIHVKLRFVFIPLVVWIKHHGRNVLVMAFSADAAALRNGHGISDHNSADVAVAE